MSLNQLLYGNATDRPWMDIKVNSIDFGETPLDYYEVATSTLNFGSGSIAIILTRIGNVVITSLDGSFATLGGPEKSNNSIPAAFRPVGGDAIFAVPSYVGSTGRSLYCVIAEDGTFEFLNTEGSNTIAANTYNINNSCISYNVDLA